MAWVKEGGAPDSYEGSCSGTVVAPNVVLTAGHCVTESVAPIEASRYTVVTGAVNRLSNTAVRSSVSKVIPYPGFKLGGPGCSPLCGHDAGLLVLSQPIATPPIPMATSPADATLLAPGTKAFEAGWGLTSPSGTEIPEDLYWTSTIIQCVGVVECGEHEAEFSIVSGNSSPKGTCEGDSGGPLWSETSEGPVEIGLTSRGYSGTCNVTISTRVDEIEPWIQEQIAANSNAVCTTNSGTVKLSPGLTNTAAVQTMKIKAILSGCTGEPFTAVTYSATLTTAGAVSCSVLAGAGEPATGAAKFKWTPKAKPSSGTGTLGLSLTEKPGLRSRVR